MLTDYPDADLISNLTHNIATCAPVFPSPFARAASPAVATGHLWGTPAAPLLAHLADAEPEGEVAPAPPQPRGFDLVLLADLVFNHSEHGALVGTVAATLRRGRGARALVFFTPHRPWLLQRDLAFLERCRGMGWGVRRVGVWVGERGMFEGEGGVEGERGMFEGEGGDEGLRRTVFGFEVWRGGGGEGGGAGLETEGV